MVYYPDRPFFGFVNAIFIVGSIYTAVGFAGYIRNVGLFKTFGYMTYKMRNRTKHTREGIRLMTLAEYNERETQEHRKWPVAKPLLVGFPALALSYILAIMLKA